MAKWTKIAAAAFAVAAIVLLGYAIFSQESDEDVVTPGMGDRHVYTSSDLALIVVSSFIIAVAIMFIFLREEYEPLPPSMKPHLPPPPPKDEKEPAVLQDAKPVAEKTVSEQPPREADDEEKKRETYLVLRLLTGDERTMFRTILDSGGEALQKDLMQRAKMSNAKVSRVLDRLVEKGVISKERHGSTNKVRIVFDSE
ncbi:MAG: hypothetical protein LN411_01030 [Candidatus Thermoplasmatota archaeon]|nr:hypothetical protein [Candidatus Thermoplasmatota archaeon]